MGWVVDIPFRSRAIKSRSVIRIKGNSETQSFGKVWIRNELASKGHKIGVSIFDYLNRALSIKTACSDDRSLEDFAEKDERRLDSG